MTNLEKLNKLLQNQKIKIPEHTRQVHESGKNKQWLYKNLSKNKDLAEDLGLEFYTELLDLLNLPMSKLAKNYAPHTV